MKESRSFRQEMNCFNITNLDSGGKKQTQNTPKYCFSFMMKQTDQQQKSVGIVS